MSSIDTTDIITKENIDSRAKGSQLVFITVLSKKVEGQYCQSMDQDDNYFMNTLPFWVDTHEEIDQLAQIMYDAVSKQGFIPVSYDVHEIPEKFLTDRAKANNVYAETSDTPGIDDNGRIDRRLGREPAHARKKPQTN